jgi:hypothetical protein
MILPDFFSDIQNSALMARPFVRLLGGKTEKGWQTTYLNPVLLLYFNSSFVDNNKNQTETCLFSLAPITRKQYNPHRRQIVDATLG